MLYIGLPLEYEECARLLLGQTLPKDVSLDINGYLKKMNSKMNYFKNEKGFNILGLAIDVNPKTMTVESVCEQIKQCKAMFTEETTALNMDLSHVEISDRRNGLKVVENPVPDFFGDDFEDSHVECEDDCDCKC